MVSLQLPLSTYITIITEGDVLPWDDEIPVYSDWPKAGNFLEHGFNNSAASFYQQILVLPSLLPGDDFSAHLR